MTDRCMVRAVAKTETVSVTTPEQAAAYLMEQVFTPFQDFVQEELWVFPCDGRYRITHQLMLYRGTLHSVEVRPAEVFRAAIQLNAAGLLVAHNHPCGSAEPSRPDRWTHRSLCQAGDLLGIEIIDHIIVGDGEWRSLRQLGAEPAQLHPSAIPY